MITERLLLAYGLLGAVALLVAGAILLHFMRNREARRFTESGYVAKRPWWRRP